MSSCLAFVSKYIKIAEPEQPVLSRMLLARLHSSSGNIARFISECMTFFFSFFFLSRIFQPSGVTLVVAAMTHRYYPTMNIRGILYIGISVFYAEYFKDTITQRGTPDGIPRTFFRRGITSICCTRARCKSKSRDRSDVRQYIFNIHRRFGRTQNAGRAVIAPQKTGTS